MTDPYAVLGVPRTATDAEITQAYRRQLRAHHPDTRSATTTPAADEQLRQVLAAYTLLRDPIRRADHDRNTAPADPEPPASPIPATRRHQPSEQPPLWAGPVRWHR